MLLPAVMFCAQEAITTCLNAGANASSVDCPIGMMLKPNAGNITVTPESWSLTAVCCVSTASGGAVAGQGDC